MKFVKDQIITLEDDLDYFVVNTATYNNNYYALISNVMNDDEFDIVKYEEEAGKSYIVSIDDENEKKEVSKILSEGLDQ